MSRRGPLLPLYLVNLIGALGFSIAGAIMLAAVLGWRHLRGFAPAAG